MFPVTITIHNAADLGKVMSALDASAPVAAPAPSPKPKAEKTAAPAETAPSAPTAAPVAAPEQSAQPPADQPAVKYDDLKAAVFKLAGKSRDAAVAINKQFGVATMKELAADRWAEALAAVNAKLVELGA